MDLMMLAQEQIPQNVLNSKDARLLFVVVQPWLPRDYISVNKSQFFFRFMLFDVKYR